MTVAADTVAAVQEAVREGTRVLPIGGGTKPALSTPPPGAVALDVSGLRGIVDHDPEELTFTALAGTPVAELSAALAEHGQHLPFDPPLAAAGATLGGVVAAGTSGSGAHRHGGVRDFVVGVRIVEGTGTLVRGGGTVVKNAAGFDLPKLMVGSMGRLGVIVEVACKVFPAPRATATVVAELGSTEAALGAIAALGRGPLELEALDLVPPGRLLARLGGDAEALPARADRLTAALGVPAQRLEGEADAAVWREAAELAWVAADCRIVRVALTARRVVALEAALARSGAQARYARGANLAWVAWPRARPLGELDAALSSLGLAGMALTGAPDRILLGVRAGGAFGERIRAALDPHSRFPEA